MRSAVSRQIIQTFSSFGYDGGAVAVAVTVAVAGSRQTCNGDMLIVLPLLGNDMSWSFFSLD